MRKTTRALLLVSMLLLLVSLSLGQDAPPAANPPAGQPPRERAAMIPLQGETDNVMLASIKRRVPLARRQCDVLVFEIDSRSGYLGSALEISQYIRALNTHTVAYVHDTALFGAALIALSCNEIYMAPKGTLGNCPPTPENADAMLARDRAERARREAPLVADVEESARKNGFDPLLGRAMVVVDVEVLEMLNRVTNQTRYVDKLTKNRLLDVRITNAEGEKIVPWTLVRTVDSDRDWLTVEGAEAVKMGLAKQVIDNDDQLRAVLRVKLDSIDYPLSWLELATLWLTQWPVRMALFVLMLVCAYIEFSHPGISIAGIAALMCLVLLVGAPFMTGLAQMWQVVLITIGVVIIVADLLVFGAVGLLAVPGFILLAVGLVGSFVPSEPGGGWLPSALQLRGLQHGMSVVVFGSLLAVGIFFLLSRYLYLTPGFRRLQLQAPAVQVETTVRDVAANVATDAVFVGAMGQASSDLRPAGKARFGPHLVDVVTNGQFISAGTVVEVMEAGGARVVVRPARQTPAKPSPEAAT